MLRHSTRRLCAAPSTVVSAASFVPSSATEAPSAVWARVTAEVGDPAALGDLPDDDVKRALEGLPRHADVLRAGLVRDATHSKYLRRKVGNAARTHDEFLARCRRREAATGAKMPDEDIRKWSASFLFDAAVASR